MFDGIFNHGKTPSRELEPPPRPVLNLHDCLPQGQIHDNNQYPEHHEPIYNPKLHHLSAFYFQMLVKKTPQCKG